VFFLSKDSLEDCVLWTRGAGSVSGRWPHVDLTDQFLAGGGGGKVATY
jgi:hypothetical protein